MAKKKRTYRELEKIKNKEYLVKCYRAFWEIVKSKKIASKKVRNAIDSISEGTIVYYYYKTVDDKATNCLCEDLNDPVNMIFMHRMRTLINWRLNSYYSCNDFVFNSSIELIEELVEEVDKDLYSLIETQGEVDELVNTLKKTIEGLPDKQKRTIKYFYFQKYTLREISYILNVSYETVKSNKKVAMNKLKTLLKLNHCKK